MSLFDKDEWKNYQDYPDDFDQAEQNEDDLAIEITIMVSLFVISVPVIIITYKIMLIFF